MIIKKLPAQMFRSRRRTRWQAQSTGRVADEVHVDIDDERHLSFVGTAAAFKAFFAIFRTG